MPDSSSSALFVSDGSRGGQSSGGHPIATSPTSPIDPSLLELDWHTFSRRSDPLPIVPPRTPDLGSLRNDGASEEVPLIQERSRPSPSQAPDETSPPQIRQRVTGNGHRHVENETEGQFSRDIQELPQHEQCEILRSLAFHRNADRLRYLPANPLSFRYPQLPP